MSFGKWTMLVLGLGLVACSSEPEPDVEAVAGANSAMQADSAATDADRHAGMAGMDDPTADEPGAEPPDHQGMEHRPDGGAAEGHAAMEGMADDPGDNPADQADGHAGMPAAEHAVGGDAAAVHHPPSDPTAPTQHAGRDVPLANGQHAEMAHDSAMAGGHAAMAHDSAADQQHPAMPHDSAMAGQHAGMPHDSAAPGAHAPMAHAATSDEHASMPGMAHEMAMFDLGDGWMAIGMAQAFPIGTMALPSDEGTPLEERAFYLTQPAIMFNIESPSSRVSLRTTLNFEGLTQREGEITFGGWGEGYLDKRHPHTLLHEAMLSVNVWASDGGGFSLSAGKGFAPYGTDDPMSRPAVKYPTNHHLSQILERFTLNGVYSSPRFSAEVGVFGGNEPTGPYDFSNAESFANSWSTRLAARFGAPAMGVFPWELSGSYGYVVEEHGDDEPASITRLYNVALRHEGMTRAGRTYGLIEGSMSDLHGSEGYFSVLAEGSVTRGLHMPYARVEYATRPEYPREGAPGTSGFFRYDHDDHAIGSTRWMILTAGYGLTATPLPFSARPFVEVQWNRVEEDEGGIDPEVLFGRSSFFSLTAGFRLFLGGEPMRMGAYGVLDAMTFMHRMQMEDSEAGHAEH